MGERVNISLDKGIRRTPSLGSDGELSECINMIPKGGELVPIAPPERIGSFQTGNDTIVCIHPVNGQNHYICLSIQPNVPALGSDTYRFYYYTEVGDGMQYDGGEHVGEITMKSGSYYGVKTMGNVFMVMTADGIYYLLWKEGAYHMLGNRIPEIGISFGLQLQAEVYKSEGKENLPQGGYSHAYRTTMYSADKQYVNNNLIPLRNRAVKDSMDKGFFVLPFLVRYAIQLKDGTSVIYHSAPVLMIPSTDNPYCYMYNISAAENYNFRVSVIRAQLDMMLKDKATEVYKDWKDIVRGVNIYVSQPLYTYNQAEDFKEIRKLTDGVVANEATEYGGMCFGKVNGKYQNLRSLEVLGVQKGDQFSNSIKAVSGYFPNPERSIDDEVRSCGTFYLLTSLSLEELDDYYDERKVVRIPGMRISTITSQTLLKGSTSHDILAPRVAYSYNQRLHIADCDRLVQNPFPTWVLVPYIEESGRQYQVTVDLIGKLPGLKCTMRQDKTAGSTGYHQYTSYSYDATKVVLANEDDRIPVNIKNLMYLAVPKREAAVIRLSPMVDFNHPYYDYSLLENDFSDIAYMYDGMKALVPHETTDEIVVTEGRFRENYIYASEPGYPFAFRDDTQYLAGNGSVVAMTSATKAITTGQFGEYPMIVFTTEGVWAMSVANDGTMNAPQPISRDICVSRDTILQTDDLVLFVTAQGLKSIRGDQSILLSAAVEGRNVSEDMISTILQGSDWHYLTITDTDDIRQCLQGCRMLYDYPNRLVHIFRQDSGAVGHKHYVLSLENQGFGSEIWSIMESASPGYTPIPGYPFGMIQNGGDIYAYPENTWEGSNNILLISRPVGFGDLYAVKTLEDIRVYDSMQERRLILLASNDRQNWVQLKSLHGAAFKYFRYGIVGKARCGDSLSGIAAMVQFRRTHKLR